MTSCMKIAPDYHTVALQIALELISAFAIGQLIESNNYVLKVIALYLVIGTQVDK